MKQGDTVVFSTVHTEELRLGILERYLTSKGEWRVSSDSFLQNNDFTVHPENLQKPLAVGATVKFRIKANRKLHIIRGNIIGINITGSKENHEPHYLVESLEEKRIYHVLPHYIENDLSEETRRIHRKMLSIPLELNRRSSRNSRHSSRNSRHSSRNSRHSSKSRRKTNTPV